MNSIGFNPFSAATGFEVFDLKSGAKIDAGTFPPLPDISGAPSTARSVGAGGTQELSREVTTKVGTDTGTETTTKNVNTSLIAKWGVRVVVIVLGFIFVAVGLTMFKPAQAITVKVKEAVAG